MRFFHRENTDNAGNRGQLLDLVHKCRGLLLQRSMGNLLLAVEGKVEYMDAEAGGWVGRCGGSLWKFSLPHHELRVRIGEKILEV